MTLRSLYALLTFALASTGSTANSAEPTRAELQSRLARYKTQFTEARDVILHHTAPFARVAGVALGVSFSRGLGVRLGLGYQTKGGRSRPCIVLGGIASSGQHVVSLAFKDTYLASPGESRAVPAIDSRRVAPGAAGRNDGADRLDRRRVVGKKWGLGTTKLEGGSDRNATLCVVLPLGKSSRAVGLADKGLTEVSGAQTALARLSSDADAAAIYRVEKHLNRAEAIKIRLDDALRRVPTPTSVAEQRASNTAWIDQAISDHNTQRAQIEAQQAADWAREWARRGAVTDHIFKYGRPDNY